MYVCAVGVGGGRGTAVAAVVCKASGTPSKEQKSEDHGSYICLHLYFSTVGQTLHLPLLVSLFLR